MKYWRASRPGPVGHPQVRLEPDLAAELPDPVVHLPVLGPQVLLVVAAHLLDRLAAEDPQVHGVGRAAVAAGVEPGGAHAERRGHGPGHRILERALPRGRHHSADVDGAGVRQRGDGHPQIAGRQQGVAVDPGDDLVPGRPDSGIDGGRDLAAGVVHQPDPAVRSGDPAGDLGRRVTGRPQREDELDRSEVILAEDVRHGLPQVLLLVEHRHDDRDGLQNLIHGRRRVPSLCLKSNAETAPR
jgi:hypothetical protein